MKKALLLLPMVLFLGLVLLAACGDDSSESASPTPTGAEVSPTETGGSSTATPVGVTPRPITSRQCAPGPQTGIGLISYLEFGDGETSKFALGEEIPMKLVLRNCADNDVHLFYDTEARYDFSAEDSNGQEVWRWSDEQNLADVPGEIFIVPEETVEYTVTWDQRDFTGDQLELGVYKISAFSLGCGQEDATDCHFGPVELVQIGE